mmetsp:Transcript_53089/g.151247  ORF Transcript_53089/g.151247 Transcript_53089/m.151247 type:complete len:438 (+) Transcript_53089:38-1351(+)|eukprot:CAMPEP_0168420648 /NCGR_PEP_ID=MMETSP0228-20121227/32880_1 /TAXON_ID=133427 /ORGANISM="Protoceratium reticulatum, Strain CCCM 535 (=CCMP 1889)" /LENGTH=437 /DNA_ID=CAMNT_0008434543 /DNA_START=30 /DNA_END=1343 /DNA_ORIENTATION=-
MAMAMGDKAWFLWLLIAAVACGVACSEVLGQAQGVRDPEGRWVVLAVCLASIVAWPRIFTLVCRGPANIVGLTTSKSPCSEVYHESRGGWSKTDGMSSGCENYECNVQHMYYPSAKKEAAKSRECTGALAFFQSALCCVLPDSGSKSAGATASPKARSASTTPLPGIAGEMAEKLRANVADLLGDWPSSPQGDDVAVTAVQRFGGERTCIARFMRARKFDVAASEKMFRNTMEFRRCTGANDIIDRPEARQIWNSVRPLFTAAPLMFTDAGNVVFYFRMADLLGIWKQGISEEHLRTFYVGWMERGLALQERGRDRLGCGPETEMPGCIEVYDLGGFNLAHLKCISGLKLMMRILRIGQDHYPEHLHTAILLNVPSFGFRALQMVQSVLDVRTRQKIRLARGSGNALLQETLNTDAATLEKLFQDAVSSGFRKGLAE